MPVSIEALGIDRLSVRERLELIEQIWDSLPAQVSPDEVPEWHRAEIAKRRAEADASPRAGKPWREALARFGDGSCPAGERGARRRRRTHLERSS